MVLQPFRSPLLSPHHRDLIQQLVQSGPSRADRAYEKFNKSEGRRYKNASGDHCVYCGMRTDRLDIDHFHPKGRPRYEIVCVEEGGSQSGARVVPIALADKCRLVYRASDTAPSRSGTCAVDPNNLAPACSACNSPTRVRLFNDLPVTIGKHDRFPLVRLPGSAGVAPVLPSPFAASWRQLLSHFAFVDLHDRGIRSVRGRFGKMMGSVRATIVLPRGVRDAIRDGEAPPYEGETLSALTAIDLLGLNRKRLAEDRFRYRRMFGALLPSDDKLAESEVNPARLARQTRLHVLGELKNIVDPVKIGEALSEWPHKLALLDLLLGWANARDDCDVDKLMDAYAPANAPAPDLM